MEDNQLNKEGNAMREAVALDIYTIECPEAATAVRQVWRRPLVEIQDKGAYKKLVLHCPMCGAYLTSYKAGPSWCENGLWQAELKNCTCGQQIDYRGIPHAIA